MTYKFNPTFTNGPDEAGIITGDNINLTQEVSDQQRSFSSTQATTASINDINWQMVSVDDWINFQPELDIQLTLVFSGSTIKPANPTVGNSDGKGTPPILWDPRNSTVDALCLNKMISRLTYNVANKQWVENDRKTEYFNIIATQFDQNKLNSYGIDLLKNDISMAHSLEIGSGVLSQIVVKTLFTAGVYNATVGYEANKSNTFLLDKYPWKRNTKGYVEIVSNTFSQGAGVSTSLVGYEGIAVPTVNLDGSGGPAYSEVGVLQTQTVVLRIREYLISPSVSNPYAKVNFSKSYYTGGYPVSVKAEINSNYFKNNMVIWNPAVVGWVMNPPTITSSTNTLMNLYTFKSAKPIPIDETQKTLYYYPDWQNRKQLKFSKTDNKHVSGQITTANLSSLPPYIIAYAGFPSDDNPKLLNDNQAQTNTPNYIMAEIDDEIKMELRYGTATDALCVSMTRNEIVNHTVETIGNPEFRSYLNGNEHLVDCGDAFGIGLTTIYGNLSFALANSLPIDEIVPKQSQYKTGYQFIVLDVAKLNFRSIEGIPLLPSVNYGTTQYKSLQLTIPFKKPKQFANTKYIHPTTAEYTAEMNMILLYKKIRTMPIGNTGALTDNMIEFNYGEIKDKLSDYILSPSNNNGDSELVYFGGGSFLGNLITKAKDFSQKHGLVSKALSMASDLAKSQGHGKKRSYGF